MPLSTFSACRRSNRSTAAEFWPSTRSNFQFGDEPGHRHPEIVPDHHDALHPPTVALTKGLHQVPCFARSFLACSHCSNWSRTISTFLPTGNPCPRRKAASVSFNDNCRTKPDSASADRAAAVFLFPQQSLRHKPDHICGQPRQQPRFDQRRFAAARRAVDQSNRKRLVRIGLLDTRLPEPDAVGQPIPVSWPGQQFQEEVGILGIERPQAFRDDLDCLAVGEGVSPWPRLTGSAGRNRRGRRLQDRHDRRRGAACLHMDRIAG